MIGILDGMTWLVPIILILGITGIIRYKKLELPYQKLIFLYLLLALAADLGSRFWSSIFKENLGFITGFAMIEIILFSFIYYIILLPNYKWIGLSLSGLLVVYMLYDLLFDFQSHFNLFQTYTRSFGSAFICLSGILYALDIIKKGRPNSLPLRLNAIFIFYFGLAFIMYLPINFIINAPSEISIILWSFFLILVITYYGLLIQHLWRYGKSKKP
ncbi:hypothetical protein GQF61_01960 [Sphingobacterium sp. DK4209]|uniref:Uncharacterized protein n=1 Tax=Sphingobacterium zhuxiongii TaxID=2662364 RepID=A0A5Q0QDE0_9SPHI|nr:MULTISPECIES: hypothetical protein [unclassified Sphingobacterium]MVZ64601.1 hypothetical protein [Sphingobacterium sp. DK4209]QGA26941.1 hypothetical protein GFH32_11715 [Sphingobacterium sp. dk4302]